MWNKAEKILLKDKKLQPVIEKWGSCTIKKSRVEVYFEELIDSIISQQLSGKAAATIFQRARGVIKASSPTPLSPIIPFEVLKVPENSLRMAGLSWAKIKYVKNLAEKVERGEVVLKTIDKLSEENVIQELVKVKGVGRWTAEMFLMFTLARTDIFPLDDLGIRKGMKELYGENLTKEEMETLSNKWSPYRSIASWYVWRLLD